MNNLSPLTAPAESAGWIAEFQAMTTDELKQALADSLGLTARALLRSACLVHELEGRGEDLSELRISMMTYLKKIACGQLLPEVVVRFSGKPSLITIVGNLPIDDQRRLAAGEFVRLVVTAHDGQMTHQMADPLKLLPEQVRQVFSRDHIRDEAEQKLVLYGRREKTQRKRPDEVGAFKFDRERNIAKVGRYEIPFSDIIAAARAIQG